MTDYYQLLNIPRDADRKAIKKAYRTLALQFHPDVRPNDKFAENHFKEISTAYRTLINPTRRAHYDHTHNNITNNPKIYPTDSTRRDPSTNLMLRIIFLGFGVTLLIIAVQVSLIVHYSNDSNKESNTLSPFSNTTPQSEHVTLSPAQQQAIFNPNLYPDVPTCTLTLSNNTHTCTNTTDIHLQSLTANHQALLMFNLGHSRALLAISYNENPDGLTVQIGNPETSEGQIQIFNQTLSIFDKSNTLLLELPYTIHPETTLFLDISPNRFSRKIDDHAESIHSRYLFPVNQSSDENPLYIGFNRALNDDAQIGSGITSIQIWLLPLSDTR